MFKLIKSIIKVVIGIYAFLVMVGVAIGVYKIQQDRKNPSTSTRQFKTVHGVEVLHDTDALRMAGIGVAGVCKFSDGSTRIVVDDTFFTLSDTAQQGALAHEEGHIVLGHLDDMTQHNITKRVALAALGSVQRIEVEADRYAADKVGTNVMIQTLLEMASIPGVHGKELRTRIHLLNK